MEINASGRLYNSERNLFSFRGSRYARITVYWKWIANMHWFREKDSVAKKWHTIGYMQLSII